MQQASQAPAPLSSTESKDVKRTGPTLLDPQDLKHVGGGLPRGTWAVSPAGETDSTALPRGTW